MIKTCQAPLRQIVLLDIVSSYEQKIPKCSLLRSSKFSSFQDIFEEIFQWIYLQLLAVLFPTEVGAHSMLSEQGDIYAVPLAFIEP